jgi:Na+/alanine symporter
MFSVAICFGFLEAELLWSWGDVLNGVTVVINVLAITLLIRFVQTSQGPVNRRIGGSVDLSVDR